ncbi:hypothetical protein [Nocardia sp. bgisy118]|uniref:hypothetical protein n=1 Tax=Nocardia sp. bgisy118 TaxID=3413786 RepID=UPI003F4A18A7
MTNENDKMLGVWVEPLAEEYWMRPGDVFTIAYDDADHVEDVIGDAHFDVQSHGDMVTVWTGCRYQVAVYDQSGTKLVPGHQLPIEVLRMRTEQAEAVARNPYEGRPYLTPDNADWLRESAERLRTALTREETAALPGQQPMK